MPYRLGVKKLNSGDEVRVIPKLFESKKQITPFHPIEGLLSIQRHYNFR